MQKATTLRITDHTKDRIAKYGKFGDSYEAAINRIIDLLEEYEENAPKNSNESPHEALVTA